MSIEAMKQAYQLLLTEPHAPAVCDQLEVILRQAIAEAEKQDLAERLAEKNWQYFECPACGSEGAKGFPKPVQEPVAWMDDEAIRVVTSKQKTGMRESLQKSYPKPLYNHPPQRTEEKTIKEQPDFSCDSCGNIPDEEGWLQHGRGCYTQSEDGGGYEYIPRADQKNPEFEAQSAPVQEPVTRYCCHSCFKKSGGVMLDRMIVCPDCGNKRCPKASNHALKCTNSNDPNQVGSIYTHPPQRTWVGLTDEEENEYNYLGPDMHWVIQEIAAKLKEKNT